MGSWCHIIVFFIDKLHMELAGFESTFPTLHLILKGGRSSISSEALCVILLFMLAFANMFDPKGTSPRAAPFAPF